MGLAPGLGEGHRYFCATDTELSQAGASGHRAFPSSHTAGTCNRTALACSRRDIARRFAAESTPAKITKGTKSFLRRRVSSSIAAVSSSSTSAAHGAQTSQAPAATSRGPRAEQRDREKRTGQAHRHRAVASFPKEEARKRFNAPCFSGLSLTRQPRGTKGAFAGAPAAAAGWV